MNVVMSQLPMHLLSRRSGRYRVSLLHFIHLADGLTWSDIKCVESHRKYKKVIPRVSNSQIYSQLTLFL